MAPRSITVDGNEAAARVAHRTNEVIAIYPITPASPMGELSDAWSAAEKENLWGIVPEVIEMQSEGGAAGAVHGSLQAGALTTTFTASQGLLLMLPNMFKIAGELTPTVFHVAARALATHALSIFGDHSDVMTARATGWGMLAASSVQEAHDFALISQAVSLRSRVPFLHFFDGFRTSHELNKIQEIDDATLRVFLDEALIREHRQRALSPDHPVLRGSAQNPDVFFQAREAVNPFYEKVPGIFDDVVREFEARTGRAYRAFDYVGAPDAERVVVLMGSGCGAAEEAVEALVARGQKVGVLKVRLFRPFGTEALVQALPTTVRSLGVLDRTKEPGSAGEPLYQDVITAVAQHWRAAHGEEAPRVARGRYGLGSKEFTPGMVAAMLAELDAATRDEVTLGIVDDVTHTSLPWNDDDFPEPDDVTRAVFFGLGSDGTVGANKNSVKIIATHTDQYAQGYFVYDSKKSGSVTVSHLRFGPRPIRSTYQIRRAGFVGCHQFQFVDRPDVIDAAAPGAVFLLNSPFPADEVWDHLPPALQSAILDRNLQLHVIDAARVAAEAGLGKRINTVMQTAFFALSGVLPRDEAIQRIKESIDATYGRRGEVVLRRNRDAVDATLAALQAVDPTGKSVAGASAAGVDPAGESFVDRVTRILIQGRGDTLPVSAMPVDGTFPTGTARLEKRSIASEIPIWDPSICIDCALCSLVCPHAAIRTKVYPASANGAPASFAAKEWSGKDLPDHQLTVQVAPDDCTGCGVCVDVCPARSKEDVSHKAINMGPQRDHLERERINFDHFLSIPERDRTAVKRADVKGSQMLEPLFEFSGACAGCGETPYLKLVSQLFGDRTVVANATGCSSIYGGNLPTTPWSTNADGRGPAWSNSLFEDNAEFGLGMRLAIDQLEAEARLLLTKHRETLGGEVVDELLESQGAEEAEIAAQRLRVSQAKAKLDRLPPDDAQRLSESLDALVPRSVWIVGGDGWAYDIGFGGLDHVLASGRNVNILVLDTEVYSNTGGQASKSTPRGAIAKFSSGGKPIPKKDLGMIAMAYGQVYVAQIAMGANPKQSIRTMLEAESYPGPSLILAYSPCIAHGIDMSEMMSHQKEATNSGYWPLYRFDPREGESSGLPFQLDSRKPKLPYAAFAQKEARFAMLARVNPERSAELMALAQEDINRRWHLYEQMTSVERGPHAEEPAKEESR